VLGGQSGKHPLWRTAVCARIPGLKASSSNGLEHPLQVPSLPKGSGHNSLILWITSFLSPGLPEASLPRKLVNTRISENTLYSTVIPYGLCFKRHFGPSTDKNNLPLVLKSISFVSHRPAPHNGTLCVSLVPGPAACFPLPANRRRRRRAGSPLVGEAFGQANRCCWTSFRSPGSAGAAQRGKQTVRSSGKC
jgi:hypothetical protein